MLASYPCKHRYTGRTICAIPCNDMDDLCLDSSDEECEKTIWHIFILAEVCLLFATFGLCVVLIRRDSLSYHHQEDLEMKRSDKKDLFDSLIKILLQEEGNVQNEELQQSQELYQLYHNQQDCYLDFFSYLHLCVASKDYDIKARTFQKWLQLELLTHGMNALEVHHCLKQRLGTNNEAKEFYDFAYPGIMTTYLTTISSILQNNWKALQENLENTSQCNRLIQLSKKVPISLGSKWYGTSKHLFISSVKTIIVHADIVKDLLLIYAISQITSANSPAFGQQLLGTLIGSIVATEFVNLVITIAFFRGKSIALPAKIMVYLCSPLMPAVSIIMKSWWEYRIEAISFSTETELAELTVKWGNYREKQLKWQKMFVTYKQSENSTEHFLQLVILVCLILLPYSESATVDGLQTIFAGRNSAIFVLISTAISFMTLIRSMLQRAVSDKNGFLPALGKLLLIISFVIGTVTRFFAVILYFAPCLGLFSLNMHWKMGQIKFQYADRTPTEIPDRVLSLYEYLHRDMFFEYVKVNETSYKPTHVKDRWIPVEDYLDLIVWSYEVYAAAFVIMSVIHFGLVFFVKRLCNRRFRQEPLSVQKLLHVLSNSILFLPYSEWDDEVHTPFKEAWNHAYLEVIIMNLLFGIENAVLCSTLWILLIAISLRDEYLQQYFPPLAEERLSTDRTRLLSILAPTLFLVVVPALQLLLAQLYYRYGHPWSRIFREEEEKLHVCDDGKSEASETNDTLSKDHGDKCDIDEDDGPIENVTEDNEIHEDDQIQPIKQADEILVAHEDQGITEENGGHGEAILQQPPSTTE